MSTWETIHLESARIFPYAYNVYCRKRNFLRVYCNGKEKMSLYAPSPVIDYSLMSTSEDHSWVLYCLAESGHVYRVTQTDAEARLGYKADTAMNQEIASDLLPVNSTTENDLDLVVATKPVYKLQLSDSVYQVSAQPISLCTGSHLVAITTEHSNSTRLIALFNEFGFRSSGNDKQPVKTFYFQNNEHIPCNSKHYCLPVIITKFITADLVDKNRFPSTDSISIHNKLFKHLFGQETALLVSPVLILCPPEGSVFYAPIRCNVNIQTNSSTVGDEQLHRNDWQILCETESVVIETFPMTIESNTLKINNEMDAGDNTRQSQHSALIIISRSGLVTIIHANIDESKQSWPQFESVMIASPVMAACVFVNRLYHSTGELVYETTLQLMVDRKCKDITVVTAEATRTFRLTGVNRLSAALQHGLVDTPDVACQLICWHVTGAETELCPQDAPVEAAVCSAGTGEQIKDTLVAITAVDSEREKVRVDQEQQDYWLRQVHVAACLLSMYITAGYGSTDNIGASENGGNYHGATKGSNETHRKAFSCKCQARLDRNNGQHKVLLDCKVTNEMPMTLSHDWCIMVAVSEPNKDEVNIVTKSVQLAEGLKSGESVALSVPLDAHLLLQGCSVIISAALLIASKITSPSNNEDNNMKCLKVPIHEESIDILYFLLPEGQSSIYKCVDIHKCTRTADVIHKMAESRPAAGLLIGEGCSSSNVSGTMILVPCEVYVNMPGKYGDVVDLYGAGPAGILGYILKDSPETNGDATNGQASLLTVLGDPVYLSAEVNDSEGHQGRGEVRQVKVTVRSGVRTAAAVHRAVTERLQHLCASHVKPALEVRQLRDCQQILEEIDRDMRKLQHDELAGMALEGTVTAVYQRLRSICL